MMMQQQALLNRLRLAERAVRSCALRRNTDEWDARRRILIDLLRLQERLAVPLNYRRHANP